MVGVMLPGTFEGRPGPKRERRRAGMASRTLVLYWNAETDRVETDWLDLRHRDEWPRRAGDPASPPPDGS